MRDGARLMLAEFGAQEFIAMTIQLANYLFFTTSCEAALAFYAESGLGRKFPAALGRPVLDLLAVGAGIGGGLDHRALLGEVRAARAGVHRPAGYVRIPIHPALE